MRSIIARTVTSIALAITLAGAAAGCGGDPGCEKVVDHTLKILPAELKEMMGDDKKELVAECEKKTTAEQRKCAVGAKDMEALVKCQG